MKAILGEIKLLILFLLCFSTFTQATSIQLVGHNDHVNDAYWSPDGTIIVSGSDDGQVLDWNANNAEFADYNQDDWDYSIGEIYSVRWNSVGTKIVSANENSSVNIWELSTAKVVTFRISKEFDIVTIVGWSFDDSKIAVGTNSSKVLILDSFNGELLSSLILTAGSVNDLDYNPIKDLIAVSYGNKSVIIWNASTNETKKVDYDHEVSSLSWTNNGSILVAAENNNIHFLSETGEEKFTINDDSSPITAICLNKNETLIATGSEEGYINIWNILSNTKIKSFDAIPHDFTKKINSIDWNEEDKLLVTADIVKFHQWDIATEKIELTFGYTITDTQDGIGGPLPFPTIFLLSIFLLPLIRKYKK
ncbi:MAG: hypothetical protein GPJ54_12730 [Candidatus Heimdallarchaeota archaeon]|nr:hypothetical protein [Candidatus Heimdallarchaeota archaeon]